MQLIRGCAAASRYAQPPLSAEQNVVYTWESATLATAAVFFPVAERTGSTWPGVWVHRHASAGTRGRSFSIRPLSRSFSATSEKSRRSSLARSVEPIA